MIDTTLMCQPDKVMIVIKPALSQTLQPEAKIMKNGDKISRKQENSTPLGTDRDLHHLFFFFL